MDSIYATYLRYDKLQEKYNKFLIQNEIDKLKFEETIKGLITKSNTLSLIIKEKDNILDDTKKLHKVKIKSNRKKNLLIGFGVGLLSVLVLK